MASLCLLVAAALLGACDGGPPPPPPPRDGGPIVRLDAGTPGLDSDGDGLCDETELAWGTDPNDPDTDRDGFSDRVEWDLGYAPLRADSPSPAILTLLTETEVSTAQLAIQRVVRGNGESFVGGFAPDAVVDRLGYDAATFLELAHAVGAYPMENVFEVRAEAQQFLGVFGRTELTFEVRFAYGGATPRACMTAFPFFYQVKREDGVTLGLTRYLLVVVPPGTQLRTGVWCVPEGGCV